MTRNDPPTTANEDAEGDWNRVCLDGLRMSETEADGLEARLTSTPDDLEARVRLVGYYNQTTDHRDRRNHHIHWLIANHPTIGLGGFLNIDRSLDPDAYEEATRLWQEAIARKPGDTTVLRRAITFLMSGDKPLAEELIKQGITAEPDAADWYASLAQLRKLSIRTQHPPDVQAAARKEAMEAFERALALEQSVIGRYVYLIDLAEAALEAGALDRATEVAQEILGTVEQFAKTWIYGNGIHIGNIVLGRVALGRNDVAAACKYLIAAAATPGSPQLDSFGPDQELAADLLALGQREAVDGYVVACKRFYPGPWRFLGEDP